MIIIIDTENKEKKAKRRLTTQTGNRLGSVGFV